MPEIHFSLDGTQLTAPAGVSVAAALMRSGVSRFRTSVRGEARAPLCGMGICMECRVTIDGREHCRSCQLALEEGMVITTG